MPKVCLPFDIEYSKSAKSLSSRKKKFDLEMAKYKTLWKTNRDKQGMFEFFFVYLCYYRSILFQLLFVPSALHLSEYFHVHLANLNTNHNK